MADLNGFNANEVEPSATFELLPTDWYEGMLTESEWKDTAKPGGRYLKLTFTLTDPRANGRLQWDNLNLVNQNDQCVQIAKGKLSSICRAVNILTPKDSSDLHNLPLLIRVGQEKREDTGEMKNVIKGYKARMAAVAAQPQLSQAAPAKAAASPAPWIKVK